jgi:aspartyl-tRNA(Asn)/glutamyl-tRNA(Gln) amidotransferase subunit B
MDTTKLNPVIGMEIHVELKTQSKMFCSCPANHFGQIPNSQTCPVCLGMPGALPVPNQKAIDWTIMIGLGLNCTIAHQSKFDRKHYFYPDLPKGYQISQYDEPLCQRGTINTTAGPIGITRVHLEEDTAKLQHKQLDGQKVTLVDFNRSSVPLVEIVTDPDIASAKQAREYAQKIHQLVRYLEVSDADMEKGSMRVEANISWGMNLGYKVEVKNINSFRFLEKAIDFELHRQKQLLEKNIIPPQETRGWSEAKNQTYSQRTKEDAEDYRYFPDPDIPPLIISPKQLQQLKAKLPKLPEQYRQELIQKWQIRPDYVDTLLSTKEYVEAVLACLNLAQEKHIDIQAVINRIVNKRLDPAHPQAIFDALEQDNATPSLSSQELDSLIQQTLKQNPDVVAKFKAGKTAVIGALIGAVIKLSRGQADPKQVNQLLQQALNLKD